MRKKGRGAEPSKWSVRESSASRPRVQLPFPASAKPTPGGAPYSKQHQVDVTRSAAPSHYRGVNPALSRATPSSSKGRGTLRCVLGTTFLLLCTFLAAAGGRLAALHWSSTSEDKENRRAFAGGELIAEPKLATQKSGTQSAWSVSSASGKSQAVRTALQATPGAGQETGEKNHLGRESESSLVVSEQGSTLLGTLTSDKDVQTAGSNQGGEWSTTFNRNAVEEAIAKVVQQAKESRERAAQGTNIQQGLTSAAEKVPSSKGVFAHNLEDAALFARALSVSQSEQPTEGHTQKLALLFLTLGSLPLASLWNKFLPGGEGKYSLLVHSTDRPSSYKAEDLPTKFLGSRIPGKPFSWGEFSVVEAERRLLASALLDVDNQRFVLLTDSCIPLFNFSFTYNYVMGTPFSFVKGTPGTASDLSTSRWNAEFLPLITLWQWRFGAPWFVLDRELATAVVRDAKFFETFQRACKVENGCHPEKNYIQTMLHMQYGTRLVNRPLTWDDWSRGELTSTWFSSADVLPSDGSKSLVLRLGRASTAKCKWKEQEESVCYLFARQFSPDASNALLALSSLLGFDGS